MPPRAAHEGASTAVSDTLSNSPGSKANRKRSLSNGTADQSPLRRSKRQKSSANLKEPSSPELSEPEAECVHPKRKVVKRPQVAAPVKSEVEVDSQLVSSTERVKRESVVKTEEAEAIVSEPQKKGRKTKQNQEIEAMPLAPRTPGLRMFVGAHVSAAKGQFIMTRRWR